MPFCLYRIQVPVSCSTQQENDIYPAEKKKEYAIHLLICQRIGKNGGIIGRSVVHHFAVAG
jgi:hypothetical protein